MTDQHTWQTIAALTLPSLSIIYAITVQVLSAASYDCSWCHLVTPISIRVAILGVTFGIVLPNGGGLDHAYTIAAVVVIGLWSVVLIYRIRNIYVNGPKPKAILSSNIGCLENRVIMITGANAGIGRETARQLVGAGATVIMACRNEDRAKGAMEDIIRSFEVKGDAVVGEESVLKSRSQQVRERLLFLPLDVSDVASVRKAVQSFLNMKLPLHVLINNAGIVMGERKTNSSGWELTMAANHFGHFLLTNLLLPVLQQQEDARVIILTSTLYQLSKEGIDLTDLNCSNKKYTMFSQYSQSKLANILMGLELTRRETERVGDECMNAVMVHMVHPGIVRTDVVKNMMWYMRYLNTLFGFILQYLQKTPEAGAYTSVFCATDEGLQGKSGEYYANSEATPLMQCAHDTEAAKGLWEISRKLVNIE